MSSIKLTADSGGGTFEIKAPSSSGNTRVLTLPDTGNLTLGKTGILQVKQAVKTDTQSFSTGSSTLSDSYFDITGLSVTLTPSSGTKCLVSYDVNLGGEGAYRQGIAMFRDSTQIYLGDADGSKIRLSSFNYTASVGLEDHGGSFLDTHGADGSTAVTYKLQIYVATPGRTSRVNRSHTDSDDRATGRVVSSITVMEVAA
mgnify:CR=1 FL=1